MNELKVIIVEDEPGAATHLTSLLLNIKPDIAILAVLTNMQETVRWIRSNAPPDLAFFDIQLEDGQSLEIFKACDVLFPVVFTTAYDRFAIEAFKVNSIDYLLKPIKEADLRFAIEKYRNLNKAIVDQKVIRQLVSVITQHRFTFLIHLKDKIIPVVEDDFLYFQVENGIVKGRTRGNQVCPIDQTIEDLMIKLDKQVFFRVSRQAIVNRSAILEAENYFNGRLALKLINSPSSLFLVSKARVHEFKQWWTTGHIGLMP
jgi:two-component system, LytTR family, response regulator LytT